MLNRTGMALAALVLPGVLAAAPAALAYDGYHLQSILNVPSKGGAWDYITSDAPTGRVFVGHRKEGLQVFDMNTGKMVGTIDKSEGSNAATLMPEFDLGVSNNDNGTLTPFKLSNLAISTPIKLGEEIDTSHYDAFNKRLMVNLAAAGDGSEVLILEVPSLKTLGRIKLPSTKLEGGVADGKGAFYLVARDRNTMFTIDPIAMKVTAERKIEGCEQANSVDMDTANNRVLVGCRGKNNAVAPVLAVVDAASGKTVFTGEIGRGNDGLVFDGAAKRVITMNGVDANMVVFEQIDPDHYKMVEAVGTRPGARSFGYDPKTRKVYTAVAEGAADASKRIVTSVSPFYANTFTPDTFVVLTYAPAR